ncbi:MAG: adenosylmethionine--8-amino-7-oxononanoate transaminase [Candidatus Marinimicrobia bacterium]|nr:adenosylmethionine--8-amino-7-oxononanoate transaminase [Candidatus Neomarinimicrobiota bacterium]
MKTITERDQQVNWHPYTQMQTAGPPLAIVKGEGVWLTAEDGSEYLDAISSWWVNLHGHNHPYLMAAIRSQTKKLDHVIFSGFTHAPAVELSEALLNILPFAHKKIFYSDNGSTAVEVGLKMAIQYHVNQGGNKKHTIIALRDGYHGDTFGAMSAGGRGIFSTPFENHLFHVEYIDVPITGNEDESLRQLKTIINNHDVAGFIFEPLLQGAAGMVMYSPKILSEMIRFCKENNVLTIADEVSTGFGRTGKYFAADHLSHKPDIICMSKGITGGVMALGATSTTQDVFDAFLSDDKSKMFLHGHSYTGNPLACAVAKASVDLLQQDDTWTSIKRISAKHDQFIGKVANHPQVEDARSLGVVLAITVTSGSDETYFNYLRDRLYNFFIHRKILLRPLGNVIYIMPPYCITNHELNMVYTAISDLLDELDG